MSQRGNYPSIWSVEHKIKNINQSINIATLCYAILFIFMFYHLADNSNRLNEHKRLLIAQQEQINKLILNAKQNELNRK